MLTRQDGRLALTTEVHLNGVRRIERLPDATAVDRDRMKAFYGAQSGLEKLNAELSLQLANYWHEIDAGFAGRRLL